MKRAILIIGGIAVVLMAGVVVIAWYLVDQMQSTINKARTAPAREMRWKENGATTPKETKEESEIKSV